MDYENKENQFQKRGNLFLEISAIMIFVLLILFAGVVYHFYTEVNRLYDDKQELLGRINMLEHRFAAAQIEGRLNSLRDEAGGLRYRLSVLTEKLDALTDQESPERLNQLHQRVAELERIVETAGNLPLDKGVARREADTLRVRQDGAIKAPLDGAAAEGRNEGKTYSRVKVRQIYENGQIKPRQAQTSYYGAGVNGHGLKATLSTCSVRHSSVFCSLRVSSVRSLARKIVFSNSATFAVGYEGNTHRRSSFKIGALGDTQNYKATASLFGHYPIDVEFEFHDVPEDVTGFKSIQFNIDEHVFIFENVRLD